MGPVQSQLWRKGEWTHNQKRAGTQEGPENQVQNQSLHDPKRVYTDTDSATFF